MKRIGNGGLKSARRTGGPARIESLESRQLLSVAVAAALEAAPAAHAAIVKPAISVVYGSVAGTVTDSSGNPISGALVYLEAAGSTENSLGTTTNSGGQYSISSVPTGSYVARAYDKAYLAASSASFAVNAGDNTAPTIKLTLGAAFSGTVTDTSSTPVSGALVEIISGSTEVTSATTNSLGQYSTWAVAPGAYTVHVYDSGYLPAVTASINAVAGPNSVPNIEITKIVDGSVTGLITDAGGNPIAGATVYIGSTTSTSNSGVASVTTNSSGDYSFPTVPVGTCEVHAYAAGYLEGSTAAFAVAQGANVAPTLKLIQAATVSGSITDANGVALAGASVSLTPATSGTTLPTYTATTSSTGTYSFPSVVVGSYIVHASKTGYASNASAAIAVAAGPNTAPTIKLTQIIYGSVTGLITDAGGNPIVGATVYIASTTTTSNPSVASVTTNSSGDYTFPTVPVGTYAVHAYATGYLEGATAAFAVVQGANVAPTLKLVQAAAVSGLITDGNGVALAGASVTLSPATSGTSLPTYTATTSAAGTYSFASVVAGSYIVHASKTGYASNASAAFAIAAGPNTAPTVKLTQIIYGSVTGLITDVGGNPIVGATVYIASTTTTSNPSVASVTTNSSGDYTFPTVPVGTYAVHAYATGYLEGTTVAFAVVQGANVAPTLKLVQAAAVSGLITDANGVALAGASVSMSPATSGTTLPTYTATTSSTGTYSFSSVVVGSYIVHASKAGYTSNASAAFAVAAGPNTASTVKLTQIIYGSLTGQITDASGNPIVGASVYIGSTTTSTNTSVTEVTTDSNGDYTFPTVPVGTYEVHAYATGYLEGSTAAFAVVQGANVAPTLKLIQAAAVSGLITDANGVALAGASVSMSPATSGTTLPTYTATTSSTGTYSFSSVVAGSYVVHASKTGYTSNASAAFAVAAGPNTAPTVKLTQIIYGSVTGLITDAGNNPIAGATVYIVSTTSTSNPSVASVTTNSNGDYTFPTVPVGTYEVHANATGYLEGSTAAFSVAQGANVAPTLILVQAAAVSGLITDANGVALAGASVSLSAATSGTTLPTYTATTSATGTYSFSSVVAGSYIVHASETGYASNASAAFAVVAGPNSAPTVKLTQIIYGSVTGLITDATGNPITGATVYISSTTANSNPGVASVTTNSSGDYTFPNVPIGTYEVHAYAAGYLEASTAAFAVVQGTNVAPTLKLTAAGVVTGLVTNSSSAAISGASVSLISSATPGASPIATAVTGSNGSYTFQSVPVGSYIVRVTASGYFANSSAAFIVAAGPDSAPTVQLVAAPTITAIGPGNTTSPGPVLESSTPTFTWTPTTSAGVTGYAIFLYDVTTGKSSTFFVEGEAQSSFTLEAGILTSGNVYVWNVRAADGTVTGPENGYLYFQAP